MQVLCCISRAGTARKWVETISRHPVVILSPATVFAFREETRIVKAGDRLAVRRLVRRVLRLSLRFAVFYFSLPILDDSYSRLIAFLRFAS